MARRKNYRPLIALAALAVAALALATMTFTNVTYWLINATLPPAMKYAGGDTTITGRADVSGIKKYVNVSYYFDARSGYNITKIYILGFTGDPVTYTDVIRLCNYYYDGTLNVKLIAVGPLEGYESTIDYIKDFRVYFSRLADGTTKTPDDSDYYVRFVGGSASPTETKATVTIGKNECVYVGAYVLVSASLPPDYRDGTKSIAGYQVNVVFSTS